MTFTCFVFFDMMNALACRSQTKSIRHLPPNKPLFIAVTLSILGQRKSSPFLHKSKMISVLVVYWAPLQSVFQTQSLSFADMATIILISSSVLVTSEWMKYKSRPQRKQSISSVLREVI
jgi:P-type Ca2+ transporter type 2C